MTTINVDALNDTLAATKAIVAKTQRPCGDPAFSRRTDAMTRQSKLQDSKGWWIDAYAFVFIVPVGKPENDRGMFVVAPRCIHIEVIFYNPAKRAACPRSSFYNCL